VNGASSPLPGGGASVVTGAANGFLIQSGTGSLIEVEMLDITVRRNPTQSLPVTCIRVDGSGGGAYLDASRIRVADCNTSGIYLGSTGGVTLRESLIENNAKSGIRNSGGSGLLVYSSLIQGNSATSGGSSGSGGGVYQVGEGNNNFYNTTITSNSAVNGGGLYVANVGGGYLDAYNCTIAFNSASARGGGVYEGTTGGTPLRIIDSILAKNTAPSGGPDTWGYVGSYRSFHGSVQGNTGSHFQDIYHPTNTLDPLLGALMDMGGRTRTRPLLVGSPAWDAISNSGTEGQRDQRGSPRSVGANEDMGAYEAGPFETEITTVAATSSGDSYSVTTSSGYSGGSGRHFFANATNDHITFGVGVPETGTYNIKVRMRKLNANGIYQLATANSLGGTYTNRGSAMDTYAAAPGSFVEYNLGNASFTSTGTKYFRLRATGKNAASAGYDASTDYIKLTKQ